MDKKKILIISLVVLLCIAVVVLIAVFSNNQSNNNVDNELNNNVNNTVVNDNNTDNTVTAPSKYDGLPTADIEGEKQLDNLTFSNIKIVEKTASENVFVATVTNNSSTDFEKRDISVELFSANGSIGTIGWPVSSIPAQGTAELEIPIAINVMNTVDVQINYSNN